jgi:hypothetical protein
MDILDDSMQAKVTQLFVNAAVIFRSPSIGSTRVFGFDGAVNGLRAITQITVWFTDGGIQDIAVAYANGAVAGPYAYGKTQPQAQNDKLILAPGTILHIYLQLKAKCHVDRRIHHGYICVAC